MYIQKEREREIKKPLERKDQLKLDALIKERELSTEAIDEIPEHQKEWLALWKHVSGQRYQSMNGTGALIHSEIRWDLEDMEYEGHEKERLMRIILRIDDIIIDYNLSMKEQNKQPDITMPPMPQAEKH